ncbi:MAG: hypothetical protein ACI4MJ_03295 [Aristaeellaceae bacterium]
MKKLTAILLAAVLLMSLAAASAEALAGGWSVAEDYAVTEDRQALFDKALTDLVGAAYTPVAYLGSQVVAGVNHCFLCEATIVYPGTVPSLALVYIYEDLDGHAEVTHIAELDMAALSVPEVIAP